MSKLIRKLETHKIPDRTGLTDWFDVIVLPRWDGSYDRNVQVVRTRRCVRLMWLMDHGSIRIGVWLRTDRACAVVDTCSRVQRQCWIGLVRLDSGAYGMS